MVCAIGLTAVLLLGPQQLHLCDKHTGETLTQFGVGIGRPGYETPIGQFVVTRKIRNPILKSPYNGGTIGQVTPYFVSLGIHPDWEAMYGVNFPLEFGTHAYHEGTSSDDEESSSCIRATPNLALQIYNHAEVDDVFDIRP